MSGVQNFGAYRSGKVDFNLETLRLVFADLEILDLDHGSSTSTTRMRESLARHRRNLRGAAHQLVPTTS